MAIEGIPYSYLVTQESVDTSFFDYEISLCGGYKFYSSACLENALVYSPEKDNFILIAGIAIDVANQTQDLQEIAKILIQKKELECDFWDYLDRLSGRYIVVYGNSKGDIKIVGDATGMLKILYCLETRSISSNIFILKNIVRRDIDKKLNFSFGREYWKFGVIGDSQPYPEIKILTPNHELDVNSLNIRRVFPRSPLQLRSLDNITELVCREFFGQLKLIREKYAVFNSVTAGIDSRLSLSFLLSERSEQDTFFTYWFKDLNYIDATFGMFAANKYKFRHLLLRYYKYKTLPALPYTLDCECKPKTLRNSYKGDWYRHAPPIVWSYKSKLIPFGYIQDESLTPLHIRSNLFEIGRLFWGKSTGEIYNPSKILQYSRIDWSNNPKINSEFASYFDSNRYEVCSKMDYNLLDIFYWEHRCGTWVSEILTGTDYAFNTHAFINSRYIINLFLSLEFQQRRKWTLFKTLIANNLPSLNDYPVNSKKSYLH